MRHSYHTAVTVVKFNSQIDINLFSQPIKYRLLSALHSEVVRPGVRNRGKQPYRARPILLDMLGHWGLVRRGNVGSSC